MLFRSCSFLRGLYILHTWSNYCLFRIGFADFRFRRLLFCHRLGIGTFRPVKCDNIEEHHMHFEQYCIDEKNAEIINETKASGGRIIPVGTTSTRTLESAAVCKNGEYQIEACEGNTDIFIYPGYEFKIIDSLITNFHLPKSTLLMLISALYDREEILKIYNIAVAEKYRFFSYGDAMFIR